jgi:hypothetical protein
MRWRRVAIATTPLALLAGVVSAEAVHFSARLTSRGEARGARAMI